MPIRKPRKPRPKKNNVPKGYDSRWEYDVHQSVLKGWEHHNQNIDYIVEHKYEPDFVRTFDGDFWENKTILLEAKGRFWDYAEYNKYKWIKDILPDDCELVFLFSNPSAPMPNAKMRRDGTKRSHAEWASKNGFRWYSTESLPKEWREE